MTNSDNGTSAPAAHQPGDRVRIRHNPAQNAGYSAEQNRARQALDGQIGSIRERTVTNAYRVAPPGSTERGAWFEADELEPVAADSLPAGDAPRAAPDPLALASRQAEEAFRAADRWRAEYQTAKDELGAARLALGVAQREAEDARQEAREAKERLGAAEAERDALRGACEAVVGPAVGVSAQALATAVKDALAVQLAAVMRTADHRCADARRIAALEARVARLEGGK